MEVAKVIDRVRRWHGFLAAWRIAEVALVGWLAIGVMHLATAKLLGSALPCWRCYLAAIPVILILSLLLGWRRRPDRRRGAWLLDGALHTSNLFGTLLDFAENGEAADQLRDQAAGVVGRLHPPSQFPVRLGVAGKWSWLPATLLVVVLFLPQQDPFGWHEARQRQAARDQLVAAAEAAIDRQLAAGAVSPAAQQLLAQARQELAAASGENGAAAIVAKLQQETETMSAADRQAAREVLADAVAAAGPDSALAKLTDSTGDGGNVAAENLASQSPETGGDGAGNPTNASTDAAATGEPAQAAGADATAKGPDGGQTTAAAAGTNADAGASQGGPAGEAAAPGGGSGGNGIGLGGGESPAGSAGAVAFTSVRVQGAEVEGKTIEELMRYEDDEDGDGPSRQLRQATAAAAADARAGLARSRIPNAAAAAVRGYFEAIAADADE